MHASYISNIRGCTYSHNMHIDTCTPDPQFKKDANAAVSWMELKKCHLNEPKRRTVNLKNLNSRILNSHNMPL